MKYPILITASLLWIGFVLAISFMEAWLKFRAPGVTLETGLSIGRLVFKALNRVELFFALIILIQLFFSAEGFSKWHTLFVIPLALLLVQTFYLHPALDERAVKIIEGTQVEASKLHLIYVIFEVAKVALLATFVVKLFKRVL